MNIRVKRLTLAAYIAVLGAVTITYSVQPAETNEIATCASPAAGIVPPDWSHRGALMSGLDAIKTDIQVPNFTVGGSKQIDNLRDNTVLVDFNGPLQKLDDVRWDDETHGRYYSTQLHGLVGIGAVLELGQRLPPDIERAIGDHIRNWGHCAAHNPAINSRAWYEGTVIKRQSNLLRALQYIRRGGQLGDLSIEELLYMIDANAEYLLDTEDVYSFGNHGIRQDMLLAATALTLPHHPRASEMLRLAERRLEEAAVELFTEEGVWKEHAPGYVSYALRLMSEVRDLHKASNDFNPELFLSRFDASAKYLVTALLPDGQVPYVGSSGAKRIAGQVAAELDVDALLPTKARSLSVFPDYGHAVVRGNHPDGLYLLFVASQNLPAGKRHSDELSFLLYNHDRAWITEGGHQTYEVTGMSKYLRSPLAHNTYILNGEQIGELSRPDLAVDLVSATEENGNVRLHGRSERFLSKATFERVIDVSDYATVTVKDTLQGDGRWQGRLQMPGDLFVVVDGNVVTATDDSGRSMTISFSSDAPLSFSTCRGEEKPICGWAKGIDEFGPATTLIWSFENSADVSFRVEWTRRN